MKSDAKNIRAVFACFLFTALFAGGLAMSCYTGIQAQDDTFAPRGPDELFTPLPGEGLYDGSVPAQTFKSVILRIPNRGSENDRPDDDLKTRQRQLAGGFELLLEQKIDYMPQVHLELDRARADRYGAMLSVGEAPRAGVPDVIGTDPVAFAKALKTFGADILFALSFVPGADETPPCGACYRYESGQITRVVEWDFALPDEPAPDAMTVLLNSKVEEVCRGIGATVDETGAVLEVPHAPVPPLTTSDKALREFAKMRRTLETGKVTKSYIALTQLMKLDPRCGRAALYGIEVYRALADKATTADQNEEYLNKSVRIGREGLKYAPNDVSLRGSLCWHGASNYNRREWARQGLDQALKIQPGNAALMSWWVGAYAYDDRNKQAQWLIDNALEKVTDGRIELSLGNIYYNDGNYKTAIEYYQQAIEKMPLEYEAYLSLGLCATYEGERIAKFGSRREPEVFATSSEALWQAIMIDPQEVAWAYEYYVRSKTRSYTYLPTNPDQLDRLFLVQAAMTGLEPNSRTFKWDRLVKDLIDGRRRTLREMVQDIQPGDELFMLKLFARLRFAYVDGDSDRIIDTLWLMKENGVRADMYRNGMAMYGPLVNEYQPAKDDAE